MFDRTRETVPSVLGRARCLRSFDLAAHTLIGFALTSFAVGQNQAWLRQFGTVASDWPSAAASDGSGGVHVGGVTSGSLGAPQAGAEDAWFGRYDGLGNQLWVRQLGTTGTDSCHAIASDGSGGSLVAGLTDGGLAIPNLGSTDAWIARYDGAGNQTWIHQFGTTNADFLNGMAPDGLGGVFVCGSTFGSLGGPNSGWMDAWIGHIDGTGSVTWLRQIGTSFWDSCDGVALDGAGGAFVCGTTGNALGGSHAGDDDVWIAHYTAAGNQSWIRQLGTPGADHASAIAADGSGGAWIGGGTEGDLGAPNAGGLDAWLAHYDGAGNPLWSAQFGTAGRDTTSGVTTGGSGDVFVTGATEGALWGPSAGLTDVWLGRLTPAGAQVWMRQLGTSSDDSARAIVSGTTGRFVVGLTNGALGGASAGSGDVWLAFYDGVLSAPHCAPAVINSTGLPSVLTAEGSSAVQANDVTLRAIQMPTHAFGYFLNSQSQGFVANPGGSQGNLCLTGAIGRYSGPGQVLNSGTSGSIALQLDVTRTPTPAGFVAIGAGQTWSFQAWFRDANPTPTSNFSDGLSVTFY